MYKNKIQIFILFIYLYKNKIKILFILFLHTYLMSRDLDIEKEELRDVVAKVEKVLGKVSHQSVPAIVYQLILTTQQKLPGAALQVGFFLFI